MRFGAGRKPEGEMSWSSDPSCVDSETLRASRDRDVREALAAATDLEKARWLAEALATTRELLRREADKSKAIPAKS